MFFPGTQVHAQHHQYQWVVPSASVGTSISGTAVSVGGALSHIPECCCCFRKRCLSWPLHQLWMTCWMGITGLCLRTDRLAQATSSPGCCIQSWLPGCCIHLPGCLAATLAAATLAPWPLHVECNSCLLAWPLHSTTSLAAWLPHVECNSCLAACCSYTSSKCRELSCGAAAAAGRGVGC